MKWEPKDVIGVIVLVGGFFLMTQHINSVVGGIMIAVVAYYFRKRIEEPAKE